MVNIVTEVVDKDKVVFEYCIFSKGDIITNGEQEYEVISDPYIWVNPKQKKTWYGEWDDIRYPVNDIKDFKGRVGEEFMSKRYLNLIKKQEVKESNMKEKVQKLQNQINSLIREFKKENPGMYVSKFNPIYEYSKNGSIKTMFYEIDVRFDKRYCNE
jgi:hypothetical protein